MGVALHAWDEKSPSRLCRRGRTGSRGCTICLRSSSDPCGSQKSYMQRFDLCMSEKASNPRGRRRRNKNRDVRPNRHPRGQTYCCSSTFNPSRRRNEHPVASLPDIVIMTIPHLKALLKSFRTHLRSSKNIKSLVKISKINDKSNILNPRNSIVSRVVVVDPLN